MKQDDHLKRVLSLLTPQLADLDNDQGMPVVIMMCGISGAGKSTVSSAIHEAFPSFTRISVDGILAERHGIYGIDYPSSDYEGHLEEASRLFLVEVDKLLHQCRHLILDRAFYAKKDRDEFRALIRNANGRVILIYLKAERDTLWNRICKRRKKSINADSAREINPALLDQFIQGFEEPEHEGQIVITME